MPEAVWGGTGLVTADMAGRIVVYERAGDGGVHVWNGEGWSSGPKIVAHAVVAMPDGNLLAARWERSGRVRIQEILVRGIAGAGGGD